MRRVRVRLFFTLRSRIYWVLVFVATAPTLPNSLVAGDVAGAQRSTAAPAALDKIQLLCLKAGGVHDAELIRMLQQRGVDFAPTDDYVRDLSSAGTADDVIKALRSARIHKKAASQSEPQALPELYSHLLRAAVLAQKQRLSIRAPHPNDGRDAEKEYRAAIKLSPQNASIHFAFAMSLSYGKRRDEAIAEDREVLRLDSGFAKAHEQIGGDLTLQAYQKLSWSRQPDADLLKQAVSELREAVRQEPENCQARTDLAITLYSQKNLDASQAELRQAIRLCPQEIYPRAVLANVLEDKGDLDGAIAETREEIRLGAHKQDYLDALLRKKGNR